MEVITFIVDAYTGLLFIIPCAAYLVIESEKVYSDLESKNYIKLVHTELQNTKHELWKPANSK